MDFIEKIFGVSPDGGNGSLEMTLVVILPTAILLIAVIWRLRRSSGTACNDAVTCIIGDACARTTANGMVRPCPCPVSK
jgi:hypothetical protein